MNSLRGSNYAVWVTRLKNHRHLCSCLSHSLWKKVKYDCRKLLETETWAFQIEAFFLLKVLTPLIAIIPISVLRNETSSRGYIKIFLQVYIYIIKVTNSRLHSKDPIFQAYAKTKINCFHFIPCSFAYHTGLISANLLFRCKRLIAQNMMRGSTL